MRRMIRDNAFGFCSLVFLAALVFSPTVGGFLARTTGMALVYWAGRLAGMDLFTVDSMYDAVVGFNWGWFFDLPNFVDNIRMNRVN